ncbi:MAG TPA: DUF2314 domain-containing protein [Fimbriimonadaceae bacterium]|nr:DUF2314 domain-containing protein [Fimbriimonadaceae bacterium]
MWRFAFLLSLSVVVGCAQAPSKPADPNYVQTETDDRELNQAMATARKTLDEGLSYLGKADAELLIKVGLPVPGGSKEHIWVDSIEKGAGGSLRGKLANDPVDLKNLKYGDPVNFVRSDVSDWMVTQSDGSTIGGYTIKVLQKRSQ